MPGLLLNVLLGLIWAAVSGGFSLGNVLFGFLLAFVILAAADRTMGTGGYLRRTLGTFKLIGRVLYELLLSNLRIAYEVITPKNHMRPAVVRVPLEIRNDVEIILLANSITLTPGDIVLDVERQDGQVVFYVYGMYVRDLDEYRRNMRRRFEKPILEATR